ncbi:hypothetical protein [Metabacillus bambusae]|uniref:Uncharacterized protein n=1 Tax=Metabacillus bambusae TaxID=2795218 RepID=A0ABS3MZV7_9BACI|nr:hypothetical protein [Metabacillus bambusae]MBO1511547.1 hypothetical protein [Metabacillus bambusae]
MMTVLLGVVTVVGFGLWIAIKDNERLEEKLSDAHEEIKRLKSKAKNKMRGEGNVLKEGA